MTHDIRRRLDGRLDTIAPPSGLSADVLAAKGRKRARAQKFGIAGGVTTGVAAVVAGALALGTAGGDGTGMPPIEWPQVNAAAQPVTGDQPLFPLPQLDSYTWYTWQLADDSTSTEATDAVSDAMYEWVSDRDGAEPLTWAGKAAGYLPLTETNYRGLDRRQRILNEHVQDSEGGYAQPSGYTQPVYWGGNVAFDDNGDDHADRVDVTVVPRGGYLPGAGAYHGINAGSSQAPFLVAGCDDWSYNVHGAGSERVLIDFDCRELSGPNDERVLAVTENRVADDRIVGRKLTLVLYRTDGTAVVVTDRLEYLGDGENPEAGQVDDNELELTAEDLLDLATSLPDVQVE